MHGSHLSGLDAGAGFALAERLFGDRAAAPRGIVVDNPPSGRSAVTIVTRGVPRNDAGYVPPVMR